MKKRQYWQPNYHKGEIQDLIKLNTTIDGGDGKIYNLYENIFAEYIAVYYSIGYRISKNFIRTYSELDSS